MFFEARKKKAFGIIETVTEDQLITDQQQISDVMNSNVTISAASVLIETYPDNNEEGYKAPIGLNPTKATGSDGIPARGKKILF